MNVNVPITITIGPDEISNKRNEQLLGVTFNRELKFETYTNRLCKKASYKIHALAEIPSFMSLSKTKSIMHRSA